MAHCEIGCCKNSETMEKLKGIFLEVITQESNFEIYNVKYASF